MAKKRKTAPAASSEDNDALDDLAERHQELSVEIEARVQALDDVTAVDYLDGLVSRWKLNAPPATFAQTVALYFTNYNVDAETGLDAEDAGAYGIGRVQATAQEHEMEAIALYHRLRELGMLLQDEIHAKIRGVMESIYVSKKTVFLVLQGKMVETRVSTNQALELEENLDTCLGSWSLRFRWLDDQDLTDVQKLLLHLLDAAMELKYKKQDDSCFEPVVYNGFKTHAYRNVCSIEEFVYSQCKKELQLDQWLNLTASGNNAKNAIEHLTKNDDYQFRKLVKDRHVFSFRNGVYFAKEDRFHPYENGPLDDKIVAAKFFDLEFSPHEDCPDWFDIPTPHFQKVLDHQQYSPDVARWMFRVIGRLLYDVGEMDGWQVIPFLKGMGGSGKSLCTNVCKDFYDKVDVGVLSNNIEKKFGIGAFSDAFLFVAPEIKQDFAIEQAEMQSMVTGESMSIAVKYKKAVSTTWRPPGFLAGNEVPSWVDNSGSIQRRIVLFAFEHVVKDGDMKLADKIRDEMASLLVKVNRAYLDAAQKWGDKNIWTVLPAYFKHTRDEIAQSVNSVEAFLSSEEVVLGSDKYCPFEDFKNGLKAYELANGFRGAKYVADLFRGPFSKFDIVRARDTMEYRGRRLHREYLRGVDLADRASFNELG